MKLSDYVFQYLEEYGTKQIFMLCGGGCMHLVDSIGNSNISYTSCLHEQAATIAAIAHSQYQNDMGVVLVTTGPGGTNTLTGVTAAWADSMPLLVLSGQVKRDDMSGDSGIRMLGFQEVDIVSIVKPITKYAVTVTDPMMIKYHLDRAIYEANHGKMGPVWLDIPLDVQAAQIDETKLLGFEVPKAEENAVLKETVKQTLDLLKTAKRPVILAGYGIQFSKAYEDFMTLIETWKIPVLTTWKALDFLEDEHPLYAGRPGCTGQRGANFIIQNCDVLLSLGARMDFGQIGFEHNTFAREAKKVVVDIDPAEFKKFKFKVDVPVVSDVGDYIRALLAEDLSELLCEEWRSRCKDWNLRYPVIQKEFYELPDKVSTYALVDVVSKLTDESYVYAPCCSGLSVEIMLQAMKIRKGVKVVLNCPGLGSMGFDVPSVLGVGLASHKAVVCFSGEGGFQMNMQELETIKHHAISAKFFVCNNGGYGSIMNTQRNYFNGHYVGSNEASGLTMPELKEIAKAYGFSYYRINNTEELQHMAQKILETPGQVICEVMIAEGDKSVFKVSSSLGSDGNMHSRPLEDLAPFLERDVFKEEMIIEPIPEV